MNFSQKIESYTSTVEMEKASIKRLHERVMNGETLEDGEFTAAYKRLAKAICTVQEFKDLLLRYEEDFPPLPPSKQQVTPTSYPTPSNSQSLTRVPDEVPLSTQPSTSKQRDEVPLPTSSSPPLLTPSGVMDELDDIPNPLQCDICKRTFSRAFALRRHQERESCLHKKLNLTCDICKKTFSKRQWLEHHKKQSTCVPQTKLVKQQPVRCSGCNQLFKREYELQKHIDNGACGKVRIVPPHNMIKANVQSTACFSCDNCDRRFLSQFSLDLHSLFHSQHQDMLRHNTSTISLHKHSLNRHLSEYILKDEHPIYDGVQWLIVNKLLVDHIINRLNRFLLKAMMIVNIKFAKRNRITNEIEKHFNFFLSSGCADMIEDNDLWFDRHVQHIKTKIDNFQENESCLEFECVESVTLKLNLFENYEGRATFQIPVSLRRLGALINVDTPKQCFKYAVLSILHYCEIESNHHRLSKYLPYENELKFDKLDVDNIKIKDIRSFEKQNKIKVNVHVWDKGLKGVRYNSRVTQYERVVNLLLIYDEKSNNSHYVGITNLSRLYKHTEKYDDKFHYCDRCLRKFTSLNLFEKHYQWCRQGKLQIENMPDSKDFSYKESGYELSPVCVVYADIECYITKDGEHKAAAIACYEKWHEHLDSNSKLHLWEGKDCIINFLSCLDELVNSLHVRLNDLTRKDISMSRDDHDTFNACTHCPKCNVEFDNDKNIKCRDHDHISGRFRGVLCRKCNFRLRLKRRTLPVIFHNFKSYDAHILIKEGLGEMKEWKLDVIAQTKEKFMSITAKVEVGKTFDDKKLYFDLRFIDSFQLMPSSLANLVNNLDDLPITTKLKFDYPLVDEELLKRKGVFPYSYFSSLSQLNETMLPSKDKFKNDLTQEDCSDADYLHAQLAWNKFNCKTFGDYMNVYLKLDVYLLADVFERFRKVALSEDRLDPVHFISLPSMTYVSAFKMTGESIHLLQDAEQYSLFERGIRGGLTFVNQHKIKYMEDENETTHLKYIDQNNLYGSSLSKPLPHSNFKWIDDNEIQFFSNPNNILLIDDNGDTGYLFEVDLCYPPEIKYITEDFPLAPESGYVTDDMFSLFMKEFHNSLNDGKTYKPTRKLLLNQYDKENYIVHYAILKFYLRMGMKLTKVHRAIQFTQKPFLKRYIDYNSSKRQNAKNAFEKDFYKLKNNALFGKTMEDVRKRINYKLVSDIDKAKKLSLHPLYYSFDVINEEISGLKMVKPEVVLDKPIYIGQAVLDYSKLEMYSLFYKTLKSCSQIKQVRLLGGDTDSFFLSITISKNEDINNVFQSLQPYFDSSNFPTSHPLYSVQNKAKLGCFKDECSGEEISEMILLRPKMYSMKIKNSIKSIKRAKGISKCVVKNMKHKQYKDAFKHKSVTSEYMTIIKSELHQVKTHSFNKRGLSAWDDKRCWLSHNFSLPHGHPDTHIPPPKKKHFSIPPSGDVD